MTRSQTMNLRGVVAGVFLGAAASLAGAAPFSSGSSGADGAFSPSANTTLTMPPSGIFHFTTVNIPTGVTVTFTRNTSNTPVVILATGDVTIAGVIDVSGGNSINTGTGTAGDRSIPGVGGPGGYNGGRGGSPETNRRAGNGLGPGSGASADAPGQLPPGGGGGGYGLAGSNGGGGAAGGGVYGSNLLTPLVGGSGGGGGGGAQVVIGAQGTGGGGGGGAILIAASGTVTVTGSVLARGGSSGAYLGPFPSGQLDNATLSQTGSTGGGGSGGAIRIVASNTTINIGALNVDGGTAGTGLFHAGIGWNAVGGNGGRGRTNVEVLTAGTLNLAGLPSLAITSVAGVAAPAVPSGAGDVILPAATPNPATVVFETSGIPVGNTVVLRVTPARGAPVVATSPPLAGTIGSATASVNVNIPNGTSTLIASTSYTISVAMGEALSQFANNERVERVTLTASLGGPQTVTLTTVSGKEFEAPAEVLQFSAIGG